MENRRVQEIALPRVSTKVKLEDLQGNGRLFANTEIESIISKFDTRHEELKKNPPWGTQGVIKNNEERKQFGYRISKKDLKTKFSIMKFDDQYFAIYRGVKQKCHLGEGGFGYTKLVQNIKTGEWAVLKLGGMSHDNFEFAVLQKIGMGVGQIERIAGNGSHYLRAQGGVKLLNQNNLVMQMAAGITLDAYRKQTRERSEAQFLQTCVRVLEAYQKLNRVKVVHCDISLGNILYDEVADYASFIDYGASKFKPTIGNPKGPFIGTQGYFAPELVKQYEKKSRKSTTKKNYSYSTEADMYALGSTLLKLISTENSHDGAHIKDDLLRQQITDYCLLQLCHDNPSKRPSIDAAIQFFQTKLHAAANLITVPPKSIALLSFDDYFACAANKELEEAEIKKAEAEQAKKAEHTDLTSQALNLFNSFFNSKPAAVQAPVTHTAAETYHALMQALKLFDQVWLIDSRQQNELTYISLRRELEANGVIVGNRCFVTHDMQAAVAMPDIQRHLASKDYHPANKVFFVTTRPDQVKQTAELARDITVLPVNANFDNERAKQDIARASKLDSDNEYDLLLKNLQRLRDNFAHKSTENIVISMCIDTLTGHYQTGHLSSETVLEQLQMMRERLANLHNSKQSRPFLSASPAVPSRRSSFFGPNKSETKDCSNDILEMEQQFQQWLKVRM